MRISSPSFENNGIIPEIFSYEEGDDINPELRIEDVPGGTKSFVLIMDDINAPGGSFIHWIVFNIPPDRTVIAQDSIPGVQGRSDAKRKNYAGPRSPWGVGHRYVFNMYALDTMLDLPEGADKDAVIKAMQAHVIDIASITGKYRTEKKPAAV